MGKTSALVGGVAALVVVGVFIGLVVFAAVRDFSNPPPAVPRKRRYGTPIWPHRFTLAQLATGGASAKRQSVSPFYGRRVYCRRDVCRRTEFASILAVTFSNLCTLPPASPTIPFSTLGGSRTNSRQYHYAPRCCADAALRRATAPTPHER